MKSIAYAALLYCLSATSAQALYDPAPQPALAAMEGQWVGTLKYRDYQHPDRFETLPTKVSVALSAPDTLVLHYIYDDGPNKTVHSFEQMQFDLDKQRLEWRYGLKKDDVSTYQVISKLEDKGCTLFKSELKDKAHGLIRITTELCASLLSITKEEVDAQGNASERSRTLLTRNVSHALPEAPTASP